MHYRRRPKVPARAPVLVLNADAVPTIDRLIWGEAMTAVEITAERHVHVAQLASSRCSAHALLDDGGAPERLGRVERALAREARGGRRVLAVCTKRVRCEITGEDRDQRLPPYVRLDRLAGERLDGVVHLAHFHALRGLDRWKDFDTVVIIGREQPPPLAIEARARALFGDDAEPLELPGRYVEEERDIVTRAGRRHRVRVQVHPDPRVQLLLELERERESLQVIDRLRPVWAETPKRVVLLSNLPLPGLPVDELVTWADLTGDRLDAILEAEGALPLSAVHLSAAFPSLFATAKAAEHAIFRRPDLHAELHPQKPLGIRIQGGAPGGFRRWRYRLEGQRGAGSMILVDPERHPDADAVADWLGANLGREVVTVEPLDPEPEAPPGPPAGGPGGASRAPLDGFDDPDDAEPGDPEPPPPAAPPEPRGEVSRPPGLPPRPPGGSRAIAPPPQPWAAGDGPDPGARDDDLDLDEVLDRLDALDPEPEEPPGGSALFDANDLLVPACGRGEAIIIPHPRPPGASP